MEIIIQANILLSWIITLSKDPSAELLKKALKQESLPKDKLVLKVIIILIIIVSKIYKNTIATIVFSNNNKVHLIQIIEGIYLINTKEWLIIIKIAVVAVSMESVDRVPKVKFNCGNKLLLPLPN